MKKLVLAVFLFLLLAAVVCTAGAEAKPAVSFAKSGGSVNGGFSCTITMKVKSAQETDMVIPLSCKETGEVLTLTIPAGKTEGTVDYSPEEVDKTVSRTFVPAEGDNYTLRDKSFTLKVLPLPAAQFYSKVNFGYVGRTSTINIKFANPSCFVKGTTLQLRDQDGNVLAEKSWSSGEGLHGFKVTVTKEMTGKKLLFAAIGIHPQQADKGTPEALARIEQLRNRPAKKKASGEFCFVVDDDHVYTSLNDLRNADNRDRMKQLQEQQQKLAKLDSELDKARRYYGKATTNERLTLHEEILNKEEEQLQLQASIRQLERLIRQTEQSSN